MKYFLIIIVLFVILLFLSLVYRRWLEITCVKIEINRYPGSLCIAHISDLHDYEYGKNNELIKNQISLKKPDYICISGDLTNSYADKLDEAVLFLKQLVDEGYKVIYAPGNHEIRIKNQDEDLYNEYIENLKKIGVIYLDAASKVVDDIVFTGYAGRSIHYSKFKPIYKLNTEELKEELSDSLNDISNKKYLSVFLAHNPLYFAQYEAVGADLVLSGHLHGGIIRLPVIGGIMSPQTFWGSKYSAGLYKINNSQMYVSRGLGLHTVHFRLFNRPELAFLYINKER